MPQLPLLHSDDAIYESGLPIEHARCFQAVSDETGCAILLRSVGKKLTGLLKDGYATKSFHIKSKSCTWGPMAGFVCVDPRFSKSTMSLENLHGQTETSISANLKGKIKGFVPIMISTNRLNELENNLKLIRLQPPSSGGFIRVCEVTSPGDGRVIQFKLFYDVLSTVEKFGLEKNPCFHPSGLWKVKYHTLTPFDTTLLIKDQKKFFQPHFPSRYVPHSVQIESDDVLSFVTIMCPDELMGSHKSATISDYDLFSVFPPKVGHQQKLDTRIVPGSSFGAASSDDYLKSMDKEKGNTTERIKEIIRLLNEKINYPGGLVVHHGDEAGRPFVKNIEFPCICFIPHADKIPMDEPPEEVFDEHPHGPEHQHGPEHTHEEHPHGPEHLHQSGHQHLGRLRRRRLTDPTCYLVSTVDQFKFFISLLEADFVLNLNPGWLNELGISQSLHLGSFDIK